MIRQTGGRAVGATSTRSSPASRAMRKASPVEVLPTFSSSALIRKMGEILICSLWRKFVGMALTPKNLAPQTAHADAKRSVTHAKDAHEEDAVRGCNSIYRTARKIQCDFGSKFDRRRASNVNPLKASMPRLAGSGRSAAWMLVNCAVTKSFALA